MTEPEPGPKSIAQAARAASMRSLWGRWLYNHHDEFEAALRDEKPLWEPLLEELGAQGVPVDLPEEWNAEDDTVRKNARNRTVKARRKVWNRVQHTRARGKPPQAAATVTAGPLPGAVPAVRDAVAEPEAHARRKFEPVRPK